MNNQPLRAFSISIDGTGPDKNIDIEISDEARRLAQTNFKRKVMVESGNTSEALFVSAEGVWRFEGDELRLLDTSRGTPGIPQSAIRTLDYMSQLMSRMTTLPGLSRGLSGFLSGLHNEMQQLTSAFDAIRDEIGDRHSRFLQDAFTLLVRETFDENLTMQIRRINSCLPEPSRECIARVREEARGQADLFAERFFATGSFEAAWEAIRPESYSNPASVRHLGSSHLARVGVFIVERAGPDPGGIL
jgi:hypothetical protein